MRRPAPATAVRADSGGGNDTSTTSAPAQQSSVDESTTTTAAAVTATSEPARLTTTSTTPPGSTTPLSGTRSAAPTCMPRDVSVVLEQNKRSGVYNTGEAVGLVAKAENTSGHACRYPADLTIGVFNGQNTTVWGTSQELHYPTDGGPSASDVWEPGYTVIRYLVWDQRQCPTQESCGTQAPPGQYTAKVAFHTEPSASENYVYGEGATGFQLEGQPT